MATFTASDDDDGGDDEGQTNPYSKQIGQLHGWLHQMPVIGFISGKYDLNVIKQFLIPYLIEERDDDDGS